MSVHHVFKFHIHLNIITQFYYKSILSINKVPTVKNWIFFQAVPVCGDVSLFHCVSYHQEGNDYNLGIMVDVLDYTEIHWSFCLDFVLGDISYRTEIKLAKNMQV